MAKTIFFLHVLFAAVWLGGSIYVEALLAGAGRTGRAQDFVRTVAAATTTGARLFPVAAVGTLVFGFWLVFVTAWEFESLWVGGGFVLGLATVALSVAFLKPKGDALAGLVADQGADHPDAVALARRIQNASHAVTGLLFLAFLLMVYKPA